MREKLKIGVLGAGSFGTALSSVLLKAGHDVILWCFEPGHADEVNEVAIDDPVIRLDINDPEAYQQALRLFGG